MSFFGDIYNGLIGGTDAPDAHAQYYVPGGSASLINGAQVGPAAAGAGGLQQMQAASLDPSQQAQSRAYQAALMQQLQQQAMGQGPSLAGMQLQQGTEQNIRQMGGLIASQRNNPMASWLAANQGGQMGQQMAGQAAQARVQEQMGAMGQLGQLSGQARGQDIDIASQNAQMAQQSGMFNAGQYNQQYGADVAAKNNFALQNALLQQQTMQFNANQAQGWQEHYDQTVAAQMAAQNQYQYQYQLQNAQGASNFGSQALGGLANAGAQALGALASDERVKTDVRPADRLIERFLGELDAHDYEYTDPEIPGAAPGRHVSVMAQELERSELGRRLVKDSPTGKQVDYGRGLGTMLAALAHVNRKVDGLAKGSH